MFYKIDAKPDVMNNRDFTIPLLGLKDKVYHFEYELENSFFDIAEQPLIQEPKIKVDLTFDKRHEPYILDFHISGTYKGDCDRCAANIIIPIDATHRLYVEIGNEEVRDETEVIFISRDEPDLKLYDHVYDFVHLSLPLVKRCESRADVKQCNQRVEAFMNLLKAKNEESDPRWEALKNLKK